MFVNIIKPKREKPQRKIASVWFFYLQDYPVLYSRKGTDNIINNNGQGRRITK